MELNAGLAMFVRAYFRLGMNQTSRAVFTALKMVSYFATIATRLGADKCAARAVDGPQGRDWLVQPCASATSSPDGLVRSGSGASRCSLNRASVDAATPASRALRPGVGDHGLVV